MFTFLFHLDWFKEIGITNFFWNAHSYWRLGKVCLRARAMLAPAVTSEKHPGKCSEINKWCVMKFPKMAQYITCYITIYFHTNIPVAAWVIEYSSSSEPWCMVWLAFLSRVVFVQDIYISITLGHSMPASKPLLGPKWHIRVSFNWIKGIFILIQS